MNWAERVIRAGAPGPALDERGLRTRRRRARAVNAQRFRSPGSSSAIIVAVDDSDRSADALALARLLAGRLWDQLVLVPNQAGQGLHQIAEDANAELIVVGTSHRSRLGRLLPGSVGEQLLDRARTPVAIPPLGYADEEHSLERIACAFDGSPESRLALDWAARLAIPNASQLRVISVHMPIAVAGLGFAAQSVDPIGHRELKRAQDAALASYDLPIEGLVRDGNPAGVVVDASQDADLLVMGSRGHGSLRAAILGSVSRHIIRHATCPVVIHPHKK
jgi:nucleotide-binding universal stress UspA family protein